MSKPEKNERALTREEEKRLFKQIHDRIGNVEAAKKRLILANLRTVVRIAKRYTPPADHIIRNIEIGNLALIEAMESYDYRKGRRFATYAALQIHKAIKKNF